MYRDLLLVVCALMVWGIGEGMFLLFQPLYLQELGADPLMIGGIIGLTGAAMSLAHLPAGYLSDRFGRKPLLLAAWYLATFSAWVMALARSLTGFVIGSILYAITAFVVGPMSSYVTAARRGLSVGRALTLVSAIYSTGAILGPLLGGWIGSRFGLQRNFLVAGCVFIFSSSLITFIRPQPVEPPEVDGRRQRINDLLQPGFLRFLGIVFMTMLVLYLPQPLTVNFLQNERGLDLSQIGALVSMRSVGIVLLSLLIGQLDARLGFLLSQVAIAVFSLLIWNGQSFPWYALGYLLVGGFQTARSLATAQGRTLVRASNMGLAYGMIETAGTLSMILAPPLAGLLYASHPEWVYIFTLGGIAATLVISGIGLPRSREQKEGV